MTEPGHRYYQAMEGSWRGRLSLTITDRAALDASTLGVLDRFVWRLTALSEQLFGPPWLETRVKYASDVVIHETCVRSFGLPLAVGRETITLDPDGRAFVMRGAHRFAWMPWRLRDVVGLGAVDQSADGASYSFSYLGAAITQTTQREGEDALIVTQRSGFGVSRVRLVRERERERDQVS